MSAGRLVAYPCHDDGKFRVWALPYKGNSIADGIQVEHDTQSPCAWSAYLVFSGSRSATLSASEIEATLAAYELRDHRGQRFR